MLSFLTFNWEPEMKDYCVLMAVDLDLEAWYLIGYSAVLVHD